MDEHEVKRLWEHNAQAWTTGVRAGRDVFRSWYHDPPFYTLLGDVRGMDVLDAGCGEGITARKLSQMGARVTGIDISEGLIENARRIESESPLGVHYVAGSFRRMDSIAPGAFDRVVAIMALMDSPDLNGTLIAMRRVLRPGGALVFSITHPMWDRRDTHWESDASGRPSIRLGDYFDLSPWEDQWAFKSDDDSQASAPPFRIITFPRTLSGCINALVAAGFSIERIEEPQPDLDRRPPHVQAALERWRTVPFYLMVRATAR
jgi:SAM-dependent methyltransferase